MSQLAEAIDRYFEMFTNAGGFHVCRCVGCCREKAALREVLVALHNREMANEQATETDIND